MENPIITANAGMKFNRVNGTVTMANGIVSILIETGQNRINSIQYTSKNSGVPRRIETPKKNDHFRWGGFPLGGSTFVYCHPQTGSAASCWRTM